MTFKNVRDLKSYLDAGNNLTPAQTNAAVLVLANLLLDTHNVAIGALTEAKTAGGNVKALEEQLKKVDANFDIKLAAAFDRMASGGPEPE